MCNMTKNTKIDLCSSYKIGKNDLFELDITLIKVYN